eukprot:363901-Chlamydomonas_euryale.AAC.10
MRPWDRDEKHLSRTCQCVIEVCPGRVLLADSLPPLALKPIEFDPVLASFNKEINVNKKIMEVYVDDVVPGVFIICYWHVCCVVCSSAELLSTPGPAS